MKDDDNSVLITEMLADKLPDWEALDLIPSEAIPDGLKTVEPIRYGMTRWRDSIFATTVAMPRYKC